MPARVFTLKLDPLTDGFDDAELRAFLRDREVVSIRDSHACRRERGTHRALARAQAFVRRHSQWAPVF